MTALDPNNALMMTAHPLAALVRHPASPTTVLNEATDGVAPARGEACFSDGEDQRGYQGLSYIQHFMSC